MGNGNSHRTRNRLTVSVLPTPHGEREPALLPVRHPAQPASNPSWGTGTRFQLYFTSCILVFQPLMGNGNCRPDHLVLPGQLLPTPHGERERRHPPCRTAWLPSSNPSWGTGTMAFLSSLAPGGDFQPLMGNGNARRPPSQQERLCPSNPSWGTGTLRELIEIQGLTTFQPLMGNGN